MPALGMAQETGKLLKWYKASGEQVTKGEPLMEVETDKVTVTIEATESGTLANVVATEGQDVPVGEAIAHLLAPGEAAPPPPVIRSAPAAPAALPPAAAPRPQAQPAARPAQPLAAPPAGNGRAVVVNASPVALRMAAENGIDLAQVKPGGGRVTREDVRAYLEGRLRPAPGRVGGRVLASPKARRLAAEAGLDLASIPGSGPEGAVLAIDLPLAAAPAAPPPLPAGMTEVSLGSLWRVMADHVTQSWQDVPHFYLVREVDAGALMAAREKLKGKGKTQVKVTFTDMLVKLVAKALAKHPNVNATWTRGTIALIEDINVGLAVGVPDGLVVPVVHKADQLSVQGIAQRRAEIVERATTKALGPDDIQGGTFTISNLGMYNIDAFNAIVNAPQAAILAVGRIVERVVAQAGKPAVRPILTMTLSCDHRVVDGLRGAEFLDTLAGLIEKPDLD
ncbi:MAG: 2-oxo acid dehydrogenase subunit E2 [Anaerolineales bacterium]|nr:2-oxo acid dehydrogenase subunit E2 [Anaerolineales bacterium]